MKPHAVLTGDLIESSALSTALRKELIVWLKELGREFSKRHPGSVVGKLDVFRGDSWQFCLQSPSLALQAAIFMRAGAKAHRSRKNIDTRVGIGIGGVEGLSRTRISESNGPAFIRSGKALDTLHKDVRLSLEWPDGPESVRPLNQVAVPLLDLTVSRWTHAESVAVFGALMGWTQGETAESKMARKPDGTAPTRQSITKALKRAAWSSHLEPVLNAASHLLDLSQSKGNP